MLGVLTFHESREALMDEFDGRQFVGIDLHRQRSVIVRQSESGEQLSAVRIVNDPVAVGLPLEPARSDPGAVLGATYGWGRNEGALVEMGGTAVGRMKSEGE